MSDGEKLTWCQSFVGTIWDKASIYLCTVICTVVLKKIELVDDRNWFNRQLLGGKTPHLRQLQGLSWVWLVQLGDSWFGTPASAASLIEDSKSSMNNSSYRWKCFPLLFVFFVAFSCFNIKLHPQSFHLFGFACCLSLPVPVSSLLQFGSCFPKADRLKKNCRKITCSNSFWHMFHDVVSEKVLPMKQQVSTRTWKAINSRGMMILKNWECYITKCSNEP